MFARRKTEPTVSLPQNPREWEMDILHSWLNSLTRATDGRDKVREKLRALEDTILKEASPRFTSLEEVFGADLKTLPVHIRLYRAMHEYMRLWLAI